MDSPSVLTSSEAGPLLAQAREHAGRWENEEALALIERALHVLSERGRGADDESRASMVQARLLRANLGRLIGRWDEALEDYSWLHDQPALPDLPDLGVTVELGIAEIVSRRGEYQRAVEVLEQARTGPHDEILQIACDVQRALLYSRLGELEKAQSLLHECIERLVPYESRGEHMDVVAVARCQEGLDALRRGDTRLATRTFSTCIAGLESEQYENERAEAFRYLGICQTSEGFFSDALRSHLKALHLFRKTGYVFGQAKTYNSIGRSFLAINEPEEAVFFMEKGQALCVRLKADAELATVCGKLGEVYMQIQDFDQAITYFQKDLELSDRFKNYYALGYTYRNLGRIHAQLDRPDEAVRFLNESLALFQYVEDQLQIGRVYTDLAHAHYRRGDIPEAEQMAEKGRSIVTGFTHLPERDYLQILHAMCLRHRGEPREAARLLSQSLERLSTPESLTWRIDGTAELGLCLLATGAQDDALVQLKAALKLAKEAGFTKPARRVMGLIEDIDEEELLRQWTRSNKNKTLKIETTRSRPN